MKPQVIERPNKEMPRFVATRRFSIGEWGGKYIEKGHVIEYDGTVAVIYGTPYLCPLLKCVLNPKTCEPWLVPTTEEPTGMLQIDSKTVAPSKPDSRYTVMDGDEQETKLKIGTKKTTEKEKLSRTYNVIDADNDNMEVAKLNKDGSILSTSVGGTEDEAENFDLTSLDDISVNADPEIGSTKEDYDGNIAAGGYEVDSDNVNFTSRGDPALFSKITKAHKEEISATAVPRKRGRPRKNAEVQESAPEVQPKRRGRPPKVAYKSVGALPSKRGNKASPDNVNALLQQLETMIEQNKKLAQQNEMLMSTVRKFSMGEITKPANPTPALLSSNVVLNNSGSGASGTVVGSVKPAIPSKQGTLNSTSKKLSSLQKQNRLVNLGDGEFTLNATFPVISDDQTGEDIKDGDVFTLSGKKIGNDNSAVAPSLPQNRNASQAQQYEFMKRWGRIKNWKERIPLLDEINDIEFLKKLLNTSSANIQSYISLRIEKIKGIKK